MNKNDNKIDIKKYQFYKDLTYLTFVQEIWLFGSRVHGAHQMRADIDLAIYCPQANCKDWLTILDIIDESDTLLKIDCIRLDELDNSSPIKSSIKNKGIKIYDRKQN